MSHLRWSEEQFRAHLACKRIEASAPVPPPVERPKFRSKLEAEYDGTLMLRQREGLIVDYGYERIRLRLPGDLWYTPDFDVLEADGAVSLIECKGWMREVARDRLRSAVASYPGFRWHILGVERQLVRLHQPQDVPSARKVVR